MPAAERYILDTSAVLTLIGRLKAFHRFSFADAVIAGVAKVREAVLVHKDTEFEALAGEIPLLSLPYKAATPFDGAR